MKHLLKRCPSWNIRSGLIHPLVVFLVSVLIIWVNLARGKELLYIFPLGVLAVLSLSAFVFWLFRLLWIRNNRKASLLVVGLATYTVGGLSLSALIVVLVAGVLDTLPFRILTPDFTPDRNYRIFVAWAFLEGIHHYLYKLSYCRSDTLAYVITTRNWSYAAKPLGGAIGVQLRRLRRSRRESLSVVG